MKFDVIEIRILLLLFLLLLLLLEVCQGHNLYRLPCLGPAQPPYPFIYPPSTLSFSICSLFPFLASSVFLLFRPFPLYENSPTPFPGRMS